MAELKRYPCSVKTSKRIPGAPGRSATDEWEFVLEYGGGFTATVRLIGADAKLAMDGNLELTLSNRTAIRKDCRCAWRSA